MISLKTIKKLSFFVLVLAFFVQSCKKDDAVSIPKGKVVSEYAATSVNEWMVLNIELVKTTPGYTPPVAARAFGYIGVGLYETTAPGVANARSLAGQLNALSAVPRPDFTKEYNWQIASEAYLADMMTAFFPTATVAAKDKVKALIAKNKDANKSIAADVIERSEAFGKAMAKAIFDWSKLDVIGHESYTKNFPAGYTVEKGNGFWEPTNAQKIPLQPYWGFVRPLMPNGIRTAFPIEPFLFSTDRASKFYKDAETVQLTVKNITPEQKKIALYWADGGGTITPPGHSIAILNQILVESKKNLEETNQAYAKVGLGIADAFICCWKAKYTYNIMRPETYIKRYIDKDFKPVFATPPFPEYTSGHASQAGATAVVLNDIFGSSFSFTDQTHVLRTDIDGTPRLYKNFMEMANEAANSRLYGGIHYPNGNNKGLTSGMTIGQNVIALKFKN